MSDDTPTSKPLTGQASNPLTSCAGDSPAKTCQLQESKQGLMENEVGCGLSMPSAYAHFNRVTSSWKTYQVSLFTQQWDAFSETWPRAGMMQNGIACQRETVACLTDEREYGWLPTPQASDGLFLTIKRPIYFKVGAYRIRSNQGIDGNAKLADIALNLWGGRLNPKYVEAMMGYPLKWTEQESMPSATPSSRKSSSGSGGKSSKRMKPV